MKTTHATETQLALLQTGELGMIEAWRVRWHVNSCERCTGELAAFEETRAMLAAEADNAPADWDLLAAEMTANIRLGVEAGECVRTLPAAQDEIPATPFSWQAVWRPGLAIAGVVVMLYTGTWLVTQRIEDLRAVVTQNNDSQNNRVVLEARPHSLDIRSNGSAFSLVRASMSTADISVGTGGSLQARDIDEDTGQVTIYHVYAQ